MKKPITKTKRSGSVLKQTETFNKIAVIKENKSLRTYTNTWAGELVLAIMDSGTARICVERRTSFIFGKGFVKENVAKTQANEKQTNNKLLASMSQNAAVLKAVCVHVLVDQSGKVYRKYNIPVDKVERRSDGKFMYNHTKNTAQYDVRCNEVYDAWQPGLDPADRVKILKNEIAENGKQKGTFCYVFFEGLGQEYYAIPPAYSGIEDILTDGQLSAFELEHLLNGFVPSAILATIGKFDDQTVDEKTGLTEAAAFKQGLQKFTGKGGGRSKLMWVTAASKEEIPQLQQLSVDKLLDGLDGVTDRIGRKICRLFDIPPIIAGFEDAAILGNSQSFKNALVALQHSVGKDKELIFECLNQIEPGKGWEIGELQLIDFIPDALLESLTDDEKRALAGFEPLPVDEEAVDMKKKLKILSAIDPQIASKILESLDEQEVRALIGMKPKVVVETDPPTEPAGE